MCKLILIASLIAPLTMWAQSLTIAPNTTFVANAGTILTATQGIDVQSANADLSNLQLNLVGASAQILNATNQIAVSSITMNGTGDFTINGHWVVSQDIVLTLGKIIVDAGGSNPGILAYTGTNDLTGGNANSYIEGLFYMEGKGSGTRTFPIGNANGYFPVRLESVTDNGTLIGFQVIDGDPALTTPATVTDVFKDHYWEMTLSNGTFSGSPVSLSSTGTDAFFSSGGSPVVLEKDTDGNVTDLSGSLLSPLVTSTTAASSKAQILAIGKGAGEVIPKIVNVITPNEDGTNDYLAIRNIEFYPENEVTFLDRYGVPIFTVQGFVNFATSDQALRVYDFSKLTNGNYICTVKYGREGKKLAQMITVLK